MIDKTLLETYFDDEPNELREALTKLVNETAEKLEYSPSNTLYELRGQLIHYAFTPHLYAELDLFRITIIKPPFTHTVTVNVPPRQIDEVAVTMFKLFLNLGSDYHLGKEISGTTMADFIVNYLFPHTLSFQQKVMRYKNDPGFLLLTDALKELDYIVDVAYNEFVDKEQLHIKLSEKSGTWVQDTYFDSDYASKNTNKV